MRTLSTWILILSGLLLIQTPCEASKVFKDGNPQSKGLAIHKGKLTDKRNVVTEQPEIHFKKGLQAVQEEKWRDAAKNFRPVVASYMGSAYGQDSLFYLGVALYHLEEYDLAEKRFSAYLEDQQDLKYFEEAIRYKLGIAEAFRKGAKRHLFGLEQMPKWGPARKDALRIYDEVVAAVPSSEIAAEALYAKGHLLLEVRQFREAVESYVTVTQHFPKHDLCPKAYLAIGQTYHTQSQLEHQNPDLLALAEVNLHRFREALPRHEGIAEAEKSLGEMREFYAEGLYQTGQFYERTKKPKASVMYYFCAVKKFPNTEVAKLCRERITELGDCAQELNLDTEGIL